MTITPNCLVPNLSMSTKSIAEIAAADGAGSDGATKKLTDIPDIPMFDPDAKEPTKAEDVAAPAKPRDEAAATKVEDGKEGLGEKEGDEADADAEAEDDGKGDGDGDGEEDLDKLVDVDFIESDWGPSAVLFAVGHDENVKVLKKAEFRNFPNRGIITKIEVVAAPNTDVVFSIGSNPVLTSKTDGSGNCVFNDLLVPQLTYHPVGIDAEGAERVVVTYAHNSSIEHLMDTVVDVEGTRTRWMFGGMVFQLGLGLFARDTSHASKRSNNFLTPSFYRRRYSGMKLGHVRAYARNAHMSKESKWAALMNILVKEKEIQETRRKLRDEVQNLTIQYLEFSRTVMDDVLAAVKDHKPKPREG